MKHIGFVDFYLSEWHANNYPAWINEACEKLGLSYRVSYGWAEQEMSPVYGESTDTWCRKNGVTRCDSLASLCEQSDVIVILAPSNPEKHLLYAKEVLKYGKRTYIDKTFAPDLRTAKEIYALAEQYNTPIFSSSALRYADELDVCGPCERIMITGGGSNLPEYVVHEIEMEVKKLGLGATRIKAEVYGKQTFLSVDYGDGRTATLIYAPPMPYSLYMEPRDGAPLNKSVKSAFFPKLMEDMLLFFESGTPSFSKEETIEVMRIREGALLAADRPGEWIDLTAIG